VGKLDLLGEVTVIEKKQKKKQKKHTHGAIVENMAKMDGSRHRKEAKIIKKRQRWTVHDTENSILKPKEMGKTRVARPWFPCRLPRHRSEAPSTAKINTDKQKNDHTRGKHESGQAKLRLTRDR
jgi:hypothetical protein